MSLASSPDCSIRAEDRALKIIYPTIEDPLTSSFDDYINQALVDLSDEDKEDFFFGDAGDILSSQAFSSGIGTQSPSLSPVRHEETPPQPWRKGLWCLSQNDSSHHQESVKPSFYPDEGLDQLKLLNQPLDSADFLNPRSPPATPSHRGTRGNTRSPKLSTVRPSPYIRHPISRDVTLSPSPMYARLQHSKMPRHETWQQDFQNFHLKPTDHGLPLSPPPSGRPVQHENTARLNAIGVAQNRNQLPTTFLMSDYDSSQPVPSIESFDSDHFIASRSNHNFVPPGPSMLSSPPGMDPLSQMASTDLHSMHAWSTDDLNLQDSTNYAFKSEPHPKEDMQFDTWWSGESASTHSSSSANTKAREDLYPRLAAPSPQRPVHQLISSSHDLHSGGLMIQYPPDLEKPINSSEDSRSRPLSIPIPPIPSTSAYPPLPSLKSHSYHAAFSPTSPSTTPRRRNPTSPARCGSISPTNTSTRSTRKTSPTRSSRRKSMGNPKASGISKAPRTPKTPKTPNLTEGNNGGGGGDRSRGAGAGAGMSFVNFTAADSAKLLNDVAPSGSSKTRARREQEAKDKRRRLSEAAVRAVRRAGGDVKALEKAIST